MQPGEETATNAANAEGAPVEPGASDAHEITPGIIDRGAGEVSEPPSMLTPAPAAPPTRRGTAPRHQRPPMWPTVIGTISIILGASAIPLGLAGIVILFVMVADAREAGYGAIYPTTVMVLSVLDFALGMLLGALLLAAGIKCAQRRPDARSCHRFWAILKIAYAAFHALLNLLIVRVQHSAVNADPAPFQEEPGSTYAPSEFDIVMIVLWTIWLLFYPIFILIWFNTKSTQRDCATWK